MNRIKDIPFSIKILAILVVLFASFYLLFLSPKLKALEGIKKDIKIIEMELQEAKNVARIMELPKEEEKREWEAMQAKIDTIPTEIKLTKLMEELARLALVNRLSDVSLSNERNPPSSRTGNSKVKMGDFLIKISFHCHYRDLAYFLNELDTSPLGAMVESLEVRKRFPLIYAELKIRPTGMEK